MSISVADEVQVETKDDSLLLDREDLSRFEKASKDFYRGVSSQPVLRVHRVKSQFIGNLSKGAWTYLGGPPAVDFLVSDTGEILVRPGDEFKISQSRSVSANALMAKLDHTIKNTPERMKFVFELRKAQTVDGENVLMAKEYESMMPDE